jgi:hypothetical protein
METISITHLSEQHIEFFEYLLDYGKLNEDALQQNARDPVSCNR